MFRKFYFGLIVKWFDILTITTVNNITLLAFWLGNTIQKEAFPNNLYKLVS